MARFGILRRLVGLLVLLEASAVAAQVELEDTELSGWTTEVTGLLDRTVSGMAQSSGGNPGAHHLVRHTHELFSSFAGQVVSASFSPIEYDPADLSLTETPRFSVDLRFEVAYEPLLLGPTLSWAPLLEQDGNVYRFMTAEDASISTRDAFLRVEVELRPDGWQSLDGAPEPELGAGAAPVRLGLLLGSTVVVTAGTQGQARIRIDNLRVERVGGLPAVSLVAVPSPAGGHVIFAPPECFVDAPDDPPRVVDVVAEADAPWEGCVEATAPGLVPDPHFRTSFCFDPSVVSLRPTLQLGCSTTAPSFVELHLGSGEAPGGQPVRLGSPSRARFEPCSVRVAGGDLSCDVLLQECPAEVLFGLLCRLESRAEPCYLNPQLASSRADPRRHTTGSSAWSSEDADPVETLRRVRDEAMSTSVAGRYYGDLYDAFSPELRELLLDDLGIVRDAFAAAPSWLDALGGLVDGAGGESEITPDMVADMLGILDRFESHASPALREVLRRERARLDLGDTAGLSIDEARELLEQRGGPLPCAATETSLCLQGGRFRVEVTWSDFEGGSGAGRAVSLSGDSGYFWFFDDANVELVVKVLDGRTINDRYWVFYGALSNVEYTVLVTDTQTGALRAYRNPSGVFASVGDTGAFTNDGAPREGASVEKDGTEASFLSELSAVASDTLRAGWRKVRGLVGREPIVGARALPLAAGLASRSSARGACLPGAGSLCLSGNRFQVEVEWRDFVGASGFGKSVPLTADTGTFWFFDPSNTELIVKVLDARVINGHFWVYYGALSNVEYTLRVTDTMTGAVRTYENESGDFASRGDVEAF